MDHGVLVVGYGFEGADSDDNKYWLVKNRYKMPQILIFEVEKGSPLNQHLNSGPQILALSEVLCHFRMITDILMFDYNIKILFEVA